MAKRVRIQLRRKPAADWTTANDVLAAGEQGYENDTGKLKIGDGITAWNTLPYVPAGGGGSGDMLKSVYDPDDDGKVNSAVVADRANDGILNALIFG